MKHAGILPENDEAERLGVPLFFTPISPNPAIPFLLSGNNPSASNSQLVLGI
jgi:hypothetical protein